MSDILTKEALMEAWYNLSNPNPVYFLQPLNRICPECSSPGLVRATWFNGFGKITKELTYCMTCGRKIDDYDTDDM